MPKPAVPEFRIVVDGRQYVTAATRDRLIDLTVTDEAGEQSDTAELRLDDRDGKIELRGKCVELEISLGWRGGTLTKTGRYTVDEIELEGPPDTLVVRAKAADMHSSLKAHKTRAWNDVSIGDLVSSIAADHDLEPRVGSSLRGVRIPHLDQTDESDLHLLTRLARDYDAIAKPASGRLLFAPQGRAESASGRAMSIVRILRHDVRNWRVTLADRGEYGAVRAHWKEEGSAESIPVTAGSRGPVYVLRRLYAGGTEAREAARAKLTELARGSGTFVATLSRGDPVLGAEAEVELRGFRQGVEGRWVCTRVRHVLTGQGSYCTRVEAAPKRS